MNETIELTSISRRRFFKRSAKKLLFKDWICQILAFLIVGACFVGIKSFGTNLSHLIYTLTNSTELYAFVSSLYYMFSLFLIVPLLLGLVNFEADTLQNGKGDLKTVFFAFQNADVFLECYRMCVLLLLRAAVCFLPAIAMFGFIEFFYVDDYFSFELRFMEIDVIYFVLKSLFIVLLYAGFVLFARYIPAIYIKLIKPNLEPKECFLASKVCMFKSTGEFAFTVLSFLPLFVISLFSFGFLFILYTLPYMFLTFVIYSKYLYEKEQFNKNASSIIYARDIITENNPKGSL